MKLRSGGTLDLSDALPKHAFRAIQEYDNVATGNDNVTNNDQDDAVDAGDDVFSSFTLLVSGNTGNTTLPLDGSLERTVHTIRSTKVTSSLVFTNATHIATGSPHVWNSVPSKHSPIVRSVSKTSEPSHDSPIFQAMDINTKPTSYAGAAVASAKD
nr:hypothetical protein [Tanacetum cinerariifolium]GEZ05895.1 hypothetical protein [Tanacetum cinerariifolium]